MMKYISTQYDEIYKYSQWCTYVTPEYATLPVLLSL